MELHEVGQRVDADRNLPAHQIGRERRAALVRHVHHVHAGCPADREAEKCGRLPGAGDPKFACVGLALIHAINSATFFAG